MKKKDRAQCLVTRGDKILLVKHDRGGRSYRCLPGGGVEDGETPECAAKRELLEECLVEGENLRLVSTVGHDGHVNYTFWADIGAQQPGLGEDPEQSGEPILVGVEWRGLRELSERERAYLWAAGLFCVEEFARELDSWSDLVSYPAGRED